MITHSRLSFWIIRRIERPLNSGICEKYGSCVSSPSCLQNWLCGLAHGTVHTRNHKSLEFPEQSKRPCLRIARLEVGSWKKPIGDLQGYLCISYSSFSLSSSCSCRCPLLLFSFSIWASSWAERWLLSTPRGNRPSPWQLSASSVGQWDKPYFQEHNPGKLILLLHGGVTNLLLTKLDHAAFAGPEENPSTPRPVINNKTNSWEAEPKGRPFKNFSLGTCDGNKALPWFHLSNLRLPYGILLLNSKLSRCLSEGIIGNKKEKMKWVFQTPRIKYTLDR